MKVGDQVTFTVMKKKGSGFNMTSREGKIESINTDGDLATIKYRNGQKIVVQVSKLRHRNERTELTEIFMNLARSSNG